MTASADNVVEVVRVRRLTTLAHVRADLGKIEAILGPRHAVIYFATESKFWHHDVDAVKRQPVIPQPGAWPPAPITWRRSGPRGEKISEAADWRAWLEAAERAPHLFGAYGLAAFEAAHGDNCLHPFEPKSWSARNWNDYGHALRRAGYATPNTGAVA